MRRKSRQQPRRYQPAQSIADQETVLEMIERQLGLNRLPGFEQRAAQHPGQQAKPGRWRQQSAIAFDEQVGDASLGQQAIVAQEQRLIRTRGAGGAQTGIIEFAVAGLVTQTPVPGINRPSGGSLLFTISVNRNPDDSPTTRRKTAFYSPVLRGNLIPGRDFDSTPPFGPVRPRDEF